MDLGTLVLNFAADTSDLDRALKQAKQQAISTAKEIDSFFGKVKITPSVNLNEFNKISVAIRQEKAKIVAANRWFERNPIKVKVDTTELDNLQHRVDRLSGGSTVTVKAGAQGAKGNGELKKVIDCLEDIKDAIADKKTSRGGGVASAIGTGIATGLGQEAVSTAVSYIARNSKVRKKASSLAKDVLDGFKQGLGDRDRIEQAGHDLAVFLIIGTRKALGIRSPSRVFAAIGAQVVAGFNQGLKGFSRIRPENYLRDFISRARALGQQVQTAAATPANPNAGNFSYKQTISSASLFGRLSSNQPLTPQSVSNVASLFGFPPDMPQWMRSLRNSIAAQAKRYLPQSPKEWLKLIGQVDRRIQYPLDLFLRVQLKGISEFFKDLEKLIGKGIDNIQKRSATLPIFGDVAARAASGLKLLNSALLGTAIAGLAFASMIGAIAGLSALSAQLALVVQQFESLRSQFVLTVNQGEKASRTFDRMSKAITAARVDLATALEGSRQIFGNLQGTFDPVFAERLARTAAETARVYSSTPAQTQQIYAAFDRLTRDTVVTLDTIRQLNNVAPGTFEIMATSVGMTTHELERAARAGTLLIDDF
ncbi:MAG: tape measure protein, partial [Moorea sp. SIO2B7]|nr:tape measure protein [Moorena sp. SIO2B7]